MTQSGSPIGWACLNRYAYLGIQDDRIVCVAYWTPEEPGMDVPDDNPDDPGEPIVMEACYELVRADDPQGKRFSGGPEPTGEWPEELLWAAGQKYREWLLDTTATDD